MPIRRTIVLLGALLGTVACFDLSTPDNITLSINLEVTNATIPTGGVTLITIRAQNYGDAPIALVAPSDCLLFFQVLANGGARVFTSTDACVELQTTRVLAPGEEFSLTKEYDGRSSTGSRLDSGTYLLRAGAVLSDRSVLGSVATVNIE